MTATVHRLRPAPEPADPVLFVVPAACDDSAKDLPPPLDTPSRSPRPRIVPDAERLRGGPAVVCEHGHPSQPHTRAWAEYARDSAATRDAAMWREWMAEDFPGVAFRLVAYDDVDTEAGLKSGRVLATVDAFATAPRGSIADPVRVVVEVVREVVVERAPATVKVVLPRVGKHPEHELAAMRRDADGAYVVPQACWWRILNPKTEPAPMARNVRE